MSKYTKYLIVNVAIVFFAFVVDYVSGTFTGGTLLIIGLLAYCAALFFKKYRTAALVGIIVLLMGVAANLTLGIVSSRMCAAEVVRVSKLADEYFAAHGKYPGSLKEVPGIGRLDERGNLRVGNCFLFIFDGTILYRQFPGQIDGYDLRSKTVLKSPD